MKAAKKKKPVYEDDSGDDYIPDAEVTAKKAPKKKPVYEDDSGDDYIPGAEVTAKKAPKPKKKKPVFEDDSGDDYIPDVEDVLSGGAGDAGGGGKKKLSVERIYQKKTQLEHILLRPDTYIGSVEKVSQVLCQLTGSFVGMSFGMCVCVCVCVCVCCGLFLQ